MVLTLGCDGTEGSPLEMTKWTHPTKPLPTSPHPAETIVELLRRTVLIQTNPIVATLVPNPSMGDISWTFTGVYV